MALHEHACATFGPDDGPAVAARAIASAEQHTGQPAFVIIRFVALLQRSYTVINLCWTSDAGKPLEIVPVQSLLQQSVVTKYVWPRAVLARLTANPTRCTPKQPTGSLFLQDHTGSALFSFFLHFFEKKKMIAKHARYSSNCMNGRSRVL